MKSKTSDKTVDITRRSDKYWVPVVAKAIDVLDCFESDVEQLTLEQVVQRTHVPHTTAYRILHTLVLKDYLHQVERTYRLNRSRRRLKLGFANLSTQISLAVEIQTSLERAAAAEGLQLLVWDNNRDADTAIRNAQAMVDERVDAAVEFQLFEHVAPIIADILSRAHIPLISIVNPHHGTLYFGVNNYRAGHCAGRSLAEYAANHWRHRPDALLLLESPHAGRTVQSRLIGVLRGIEERLGPLGDKHVHHLDGAGERATSRAAIENFFRRHSPERVLIAGLNDESAMGAADAEKSMRGADVAIVGHGACAEMMALVACPGSPCIGTVSFRAPLYGPELVKFAQSVIQGGSATAAKYVPHEFLGKAALAKSGDRLADSAYASGA